MLQTTPHKRSINVVRLADMIVALKKTERKRQNAQPVLPEMVAQTDVSEGLCTLVRGYSCPKGAKSILKTLPLIHSLIRPLIRRLDKITIHTSEASVP